MYLVKIGIIFLRFFPEAPFSRKLLKNGSVSIQVGWAAPAPPRPLVFRVFVLHTEAVGEIHFGDSVCPPRSSQTAMN